MIIKNIGVTRYRKYHEDETFMLWKPFFFSENSQVIWPDVAQASTVILCGYINTFISHNQANRIRSSSAAALIWFFAPQVTKRGVFLSSPFVSGTFLDPSLRARAWKDWKGTPSLRVLWGSAYPSKHISNLSSRQRGTKAELNVHKLALKIGTIRRIKTIPIFLATRKYYERLVVRCWATCDVATSFVESSFLLFGYSKWRRKVRNKGKDHYWVAPDKQD